MTDETSPETGNEAGTEANETGSAKTEANETGSAKTEANADDERVVRNDERERYELWRGNTLVGVADVREMNGATVFTHTGIRPEFQGAGSGSTLVKAALEDTVARGEKIVAGCSFVADYVAEHHEFDEHLASPDTLR
ncbi:GNAT family N-acetyltransferase [Okibacterium fritillariae]|uniref:Predicted acetyltransferase, GNAT superfamily n=1 Tax=Okibacterium fritillariae TaxID=123320 RepID=A0A1T5KTL4_9MICO|nr:GNAT family N-acetyltransferase [Okibacterium fritillariae]SKC67122.1 Predicted acetyltransferase, GNAT superfamily [Okibacterium fritillariae]